MSTDDHTRIYLKNLKRDPTWKPDGKPDEVRMTVNVDCYASNSMTADSFTSTLQDGFVLPRFDSFHIEACNALRAEKKALEQKLLILEEKLRQEQFTSAQLRADLEKRRSVMTNFEKVLAGG